MLVLHHVTYSINSLCHFFGRRSFATGDESRNLAWLAPLTFGEAWHNNHHAFPTSAAHGLRRWRGRPLRGGDPGAGDGSASRGTSCASIPPAQQAEKPPADAGVASRVPPRVPPHCAASSSAALPERPFAVELLGRHRAWPPTTGDGPDVPASRSPAALAHVLRAPGQLGLGRAYVSGELEVDDLDAALELLDRWQPPPLERGRARAAVLAAAARVRACALPPRPPAAELRPRGRRHSRARDARAVRHHYDLPHEFFALFLGESMTYSCAIFSRGATTLEEAQETKLELVCSKLGAGAGRAGARRRLRLGKLRDPRRPAARRARGRHHALRAAGGARAAGGSRSWGSRTASRSASPTTASSRDEPFDAVASIGMVEHVGASQIDLYAQPARARCCARRAGS